MIINKINKFVIMISLLSNFLKAYTIMQFILFNNKSRINKLKNNSR